MPLQTRLRRTSLREAPTLDAAAIELIQAKVRQIARRVGATRSDRPDLEQDIALHVWQRLARFDNTKAECSAFVRMLVGHAVATVFRGRRRQTRRAPASLEALLRQPSDRPLEPMDAFLTRRESERALSLDVATVLAMLPWELRRVAEALKTRSVTQVARHLGLSRAAVYRRLEQMRAAFEEAGLGVHL